MPQPTPPPSPARVFLGGLQFTLGTAALTVAASGVDWRAGVATAGALLVVASRFWRFQP